MSEMFNVLLGRSRYSLFTNNKKKLSFFSKIFDLQRGRRDFLIMKKNAAHFR